MSFRYGDVRLGPPGLLVPSQNSPMVLILLCFLPLELPSAYSFMESRNRVTISQVTGMQTQYNIFLVNFCTDAFGQLREGEGRAIDDRAAEQCWMDAWTIFYMAWWTSWCGFVGLFIARISKGRTVPNVVLFSLFCPLIYSFIWFGVFGGVGLRQARQAMKLQKVGEDFLAIPTFSRLILQIVSTFLKRM
jgi:hypothetical protein